MNPRRSPLLFLAIAFWTIALCALYLLARVQTMPLGWDAKSYVVFMNLVRNGGDPYADSIAAQQIYRARFGGGIPPPVRVQCVDEPCGYVYTPLTLPPLKLAAKLPPRVLEIAYVVVCLLCCIATPILLLVATRPGLERTLFTLLAPAALFFPGLILDFVVFSGNIAYILYALAFAGAVLGWKRHQWLPFYLAVLLASFFKPPLLTLVAISVLSHRQAWRGTLLTALAGLCFFAAQPLVWPREFAQYLQVIDMLFRFDADFGFSPAGLLATLLTHTHRAYSPWTTLAYLTYAIAVVAVLWVLRRRYLRGDVTLEAWIPVMLLGTMLLNPRNKEYDVAAFTLPIALITWRLFHRANSLPRAALLTAFFLIAVSLLSDRITMQTTYGLLTPALFAAAAFDLLRPVAGSIATRSRVTPDHSLSPSLNPGSVG